MPYFLVQISYTSESWRNLVREPQNRSVIVLPAIKDLGGEIVCSFLSFGSWDAIGILRFPDNIGAAALSMLIMGGGGIRQVETTPLVTWEEGMEAMRKAKKIAYKPPESNPMIDRR